MSDRVDRFEFERAIRALPLRPPVRKLIALLLGTYADKDGSNIHPGEDRLAAEAGITARAARGHLAALRALGLIERTFIGSQSGRKRLADVYELALPADILERLATADHRNLASGDSDPITGTSVADHRNLGADHRNLSVRNTGTQVPPTNTSTTDANHPSPAPHSSVPQPQNARASLADHNGWITEHEFNDDGSGASCGDCGLMQNHPRHNTRRSA